MSEKYVVSQEFMNELKDWKKRGNTDVYFVGSYDISMLPIDVIRWWDYPEITNFEQNNRLIAILRWVNGEDVFEVIDEVQSVDSPTNQTTLGDVISELQEQFRQVGNIDVKVYESDDHMVITYE